MGLKALVCFLYACWLGARATPDCTPPQLPMGGSCGWLLHCCLREARLHA